MRPISIIPVVVAFAFWSALWILLVGSVTVAAVIGGGLIYGAAVFILLLANSRVWGRLGADRRTSQPARQQIALADYRGQQLPPTAAQHLNGKVIEIDGEHWTVNEQGGLVPYHAGDGLEASKPADGLAGLDEEMEAMESWDAF